MKTTHLLAGGIVAGLIIVLGEGVLNLAILADAWTGIFARFALPQPGPATAAQGLLKLLLLGIFSVWLAGRLRPAHATADRAAIAAGLIVWFLVWAWVQWGMLLAGYVTAEIALLTVAWGLFELPLATWVGYRLQARLNTGQRGSTKREAISLQ